MSKSDLKAAMNSLQVNRPLRLPSRAPSFVPPVSSPSPQTLVENPTQVENKTEVQLATQVSQQTQVEINTPVEKKTEVALVAQVDSTTEVLKVTQVLEPTGVQNQTAAVVESETQVAKSTLVPEAIPVSLVTEVLNETPVIKSTEVKAITAAHADQSTAVRRATEQDSSVVLEARAVEGLEKGYTRLPNTVLMKMAHGDLTRGEIKMLLLIARFTISFQRKLAPLSKTVLERQSGLRGPAVLEALSGLVSKKLIVKEQGDQHRPNMLGLVLPPDWDQLVKPTTSVEIKTPVEKQALVGKTTTDGSTPPALSLPQAEVQKTTSAPVQNPTPFKDIKKYQNKNSHSQLPEKLKTYFDELKPAKKRESEWKAFQELCSDYEIQDIADCFSVICERGVGAESETCHSPMAFLSKAIGSVFTEVKEHRKKSQERLEREQREGDAKRKQAEIEAREVMEWEMKENAFLKAFPTVEQQQTVLARMCIGIPFNPTGEAARVIGIGKWWESTSNAQK